jgi:Zn-dependent M32 family carboxypeptidase
VVRPKSAEGLSTGEHEASVNPKKAEIAMMDTRLRLHSTDLVDRIAKSSAERRRRATIIACQAAIKHSALSDPMVITLLSNLSDEIKIDDSARKKLEQLIDDLDEQALDDPELDKAYRGDLSRHNVIFNKARAANAVLFALDHGEAWLEAAESIYEAFVCLDNRDEVKKLRKTIEEVL